MTKRTLQPIVERSLALHEDLMLLWSDLPEPPSHRSLAVIGFASIVRQHAVSQLLLAQAELDVSATTLVRPAYEALIRAIWCLGGADDAWIERFLTYKPEVDLAGVETTMGPPVQAMLDRIAAKHPAHVHRMLAELKERTWRAMHSYVHGGVRPFVQGLAGFQEHEVAGVVINANAMFIVATNVVRMACGLRSPQLPELQRRHAACLPPEHQEPGPKIGV